MTQFNETDFNEVFSILEASFPPDERRPEELQREIMADPLCRSYVHRAGGEIVGFFITWALGGFSYIEHFAVREDLRSTGIGSALLDELTALLPHPICLEAEPPETDIARRRIAFYERHGFKYSDRVWMQLPLAPGQQSVPLRLMTYPEPVDDRMYGHMRREIVSHVFDR